MEPTAGVTHIGAETPEKPPGTGSIRPLGIFADWRLQAYGYTVAALYAAMFYYWYRLGIWFVDRSGAPSVNDFTVFWIAGKQALHLGVAAASGSTDFASVEKILLGPAYRADSFYPPVFLLVEAPLALLPYGPAFLGFQAITLAASAVVVFLIVRRRAAVALALSSPFAATNILNGQTGFLRGALLGAALLTLERNPVLGGVFFGCLVYKPQFGILIPVGLAAARQWRALASAALTALFLAGASIAIFGIGPWERFPPALLAQAGHYLLPVHPRIETWVGIQSTYGTLRALGGSPDLAWCMQGCVTAGAAVVARTRTGPATSEPIVPMARMAGAKIVRLIRMICLHASTEMDSL